MVDWLTPQEISKDAGKWNQFIYFFKCCIFLCIVPGVPSNYCCCHCRRFLQTCLFALRRLLMGINGDLGLWVVPPYQTPQISLASCKPHRPFPSDFQSLSIPFFFRVFVIFPLSYFTVLILPLVFFFLCRYCMLLSFVGLWVILFEHYSYAYFLIGLSPLPSPQRFFSLSNSIFHFSDTDF